MLVNYPRWLKQYKMYTYLRRKLENTWKKIMELKGEID